PPVQPAAPPLEPAAVTTRYRLAMQESPLPADCPAAPAWSGGVIVLGDGRVAEALESRLKRERATVHRLSPGAGLEAVLAEVERICAAGPAPHLFLTTARDGQKLDCDDETHYRRLRDE